MIKKDGMIVAGDSNYYFIIFHIFSFKIVLYIYLNNEKASGIIICLHVFFILFISVMRHTTRLLKQHALKGQQLLAQGSALGNHRRAPLAL
nr:MAG TPA_asm: hypothetical protein [Caudoviricetes sp.]